MTVNSVLCKVKESTPSVARFFVCSKCEKATNGAKALCNLGDKLNASGGCETAVTARTRVGWKKILLEKDFLCRWKKIFFADEIKDNDLAI